MITPPDKPVTVAIADDHALMRSALANLITSSNNNYKVCIEAKNGKDLLDQLDRVGLTDIILLDISMPVMDGFETMSILNKKYSHPNVIAFTVHDNQSAILQMSLLGVKGYLYKSLDHHEILTTINTVVKDGQYFSAEVKKQLQLATQNDLPRKIASLKTRELSFLKHLCKGMTYKEIAAAMHVSAYTVEDYRDALFKKFEMKSKTELVLFALQHKIVEKE